HILPDLLAANVGVASRFSLNAENDGGAGTSLEALAGVQLTPAKTMLVDVGFGKGLSTGYGSTDFRVMAGFTYIIAPPEPVIEPVVERDPEEDRKVAVEEIPDVEILPEPVVEAPKVQWKEGELARVQEKEIIIRDPIQFEEGNANILAGSLPILKEVARLMNENGQIGFMIIEGHASAEGSFEYNYDLSNLRARSIWQALIEAGVHPARIGYRGMGEVQPVVSGDDQAAREANRRVVFAIVRQYQPGDKIPELKTEVRLPWNGEVRNIAAPKLPESFIKAAEEAANPPAPAPAPPPPPRVEANKDVPDANIFRQDDDEDEEPKPAPQNGGGQ
ncbi:MAG TPA: OmpA family protein, partial [Myxococcota bacterium]|nr:OmpA family protein [Myxococcota bacterium]